jgi:hypothetical protein
MLNGEGEGEDLFRLCSSKDSQYELSDVIHDVASKLLFRVHICFHAWIFDAAHVVLVRLRYNVEHDGMHETSACSGVGPGHRTCIGARIEARDLRMVIGTQYVLTARYLLVCVSYRQRSSRAKTCMSHTQNHRSQDKERRVDFWSST